MAFNKQSVRLGGAYVEITADSTSLYHALKDAEDQVKSFVNEFATIGAGMVGIGAAIVVPFKKAADTYAEFERQMLITQAVTKATKLQIASLTAQAKQLGATTSWTATQVAQGMVALGRMGFDKTEIENSISSVMDLGRALDVDVNIAAKELGSVMRQFGAGSHEATRYADVLAEATNGAAIEMSDLLETMKYVGSAGRAIGADVENVIALVMALRNAGATASQAGTQLRTMFLKIQNPKSVNIFKKEFGVDIYDANGRLKSFLDIMVEAQERASVMGDKLGVVAKQLFGTLQSPGFLTLMQTKGLEEFRDQLYEASGSAKNFREKMESGVFGALKLSESAIESVGLQLGQTIAPSVKRVTRMIQDASEVVRGFIRDNATLVNKVAMAGVKFLTLGGSMLAASGILKGFSAISRSGINIVSSFAGAWSKASAQIDAYRRSLAEVQRQDALNFGLDPKDAEKIFNVAYSKAKQATKGFVALRFAINACASALRGLAGIAVSFVAWNMVAKTFDYIAKKAEEAAESMRQAQESNAAIMEKDATKADNAESSLTTDEELIDKLVDGASSNRVLNNVEKQNLKNIYNNLNEKGLIQDDVIVDEDSPTGFRIKDASSPSMMKYRAANREANELGKATFDELKIDLHSIDPVRFPKGSIYDAYDVNTMNLDFDKLERVGKIIDNMTEEQKDKFFGHGSLEDTFANDTRLTTDLSQYMPEVITGNGNVGLNIARAFTKNGERIKGAAVNPEVFSFMNKRATEAGIYGEDAQLLGEFLLGLGGVDAKTGKYTTSQIDASVLAGFVGNKGAGFSEFITQLKEFGKTRKKRRELGEKASAYLADAIEAQGAPYENQEDKDRARLLAEAKQEDRNAAYAELDATLAKTEDKAKTPSQRALETLDKQWEKIQEEIGLDEEGNVDLSGLDKKERDEYYKREKKVLEERDRLLRKINDEQQQINEELEREAKQRAKENSERVVEGLNADVRDFIGAIFAGNGQKADELGAGIDAQLRNFAGTDVDLSKFYEESVSTIRDALERTKTTLSSTGTFNAYEAADFGRDYQLDVQKEQLAMLRSANRGLQNIYAFMQSDEAYKEYM